MAECRYCGAEVTVSEKCEYCGRLAEPMYYPNYTPDKEDILPLQEKCEPLVKVGKNYTITSGDTLWGISKRAYGKGALYRLIMKHNKSIKDANRIYAGQVIFIPPYVEPKGGW